MSMRAFSLVATVVALASRAASGFLTGQGASRTARRQMTIALEKKVAVTEWAQRMTDEEEGDAM